MKLKRQVPLEKGQVWQTSAAGIEILWLGKSYVHYRVIKQLGRKEVSAQISPIEPMRNYLEANGARLVKGSARSLTMSHH